MEAGILWREEVQALRDKEYKKVKQKSDNKVKGFEMMKLSLPKELNKPNQEIKSLMNYSDGIFSRDRKSDHCPFKEVNLLRPSNTMSQICSNQQF